MRVYHGEIVSCDAGGAIFKWLAEDAGRIVFLGNELPEHYRNAPVVEVSGALLPAFVDTHVHLSSYAIFMESDIKPARSHAEILEMLLDYDRRCKPKNVLTFGASAHSVKEKRLIRRDELDRAFPKKPVLIVCYDGHSCILNTKMLGLLPKAVTELRGFDAESGNITRDAFYRTVDFITGKVPLPQLAGSLARAYDRMAANGIGMVHAAEGVGFVKDLDVTLSSAIARSRKSGFQTRMFFQTTDIAKVKKRGLPRVGGCFAAALDGCFGCCDAAVHEPYEGQPDNCGILYRDPAEVHNFIIDAHRQGIQVELHCIGDHAVDVFLDAVEAAQKDAYRSDHRHTMIHAELMSQEQRERTAELGVLLARQPYFLEWNLEPPEYYRSILGERESSISLYKKELEMGLIIGAGSDAPVSNPEPLRAIHKLLNQKDPDKNITIEQALRMHTYWGAYITFDEKERGSLETGKIADMIMLDRNPLEADPATIADIKVTATILGGRPYKPGQGIAGALAGGFSRGGI